MTRQYTSGLEPEPHIHGLHFDVRGGTMLAADIALLPDGTLWSHFAHLGTFRKDGVEFTIDAAKVRAMAVNFDKYPRKVPADYDHGSTSGIADGSRPVIKAGDVFEVRAVLSDSDIIPPMREQIDRYTAQLAAMNKKAPEPWGLWGRWRPTPRAAQFVQNREYTELSIAFADEYVNAEGVSQGPTLFAVALTNTPFLNKMLPIAASHGARGPSPSPEQRTMPNESARLYTLMSARSGKAVTNDAEAEAVLNQMSTELGRLAPLAEVGSAVRDALSLGENATAASVRAAIVQLKAENDAHKATAASAQRARVEAEADAILRENEKKLTPILQAHFRPLLIANLSAGQVKGQTDTEATIKHLADGPANGKPAASAGDTPADAADADVRLAQRQDELLATDDECKALTAKGDKTGAVELAHRKARREMRTGGGAAGKGTERQAVTA